MYNKYYVHLSSGSLAEIKEFFVMEDMLECVRQHYHQFGHLPRVYYGKVLSFSDLSRLDLENQRRRTMTDKPIMHGLWRDDPKTPEGKYLVKRRDGTVPEWPNFTLGARDPCAPAALRAYALTARMIGMNEGYVNAVLKLADEFEHYRMEHGDGDPDRGPHRKDDPATIAEMKLGRSV